MTTNTISILADKWFPMPVEKFFTPQRAPDMWFGDELPPTVQALMHSPFVVQAKQMAAYRIHQSLAAIARRKQAQAEQKSRKAQLSRVGKRVKASRH